MGIFLERCKNDVDEKTEVTRCLIFVLFFMDNSTSELGSHEFVHVCDAATLLGRREGTKGLDCAPTPQIP